MPEKLSNILNLIIICCCLFNTVQYSQGDDDVNNELSPTLIGVGDDGEDAAPQKYFYDEELLNTELVLEHELINEQADQPTSGERFVAVHVDKLGAIEQLNPSLVSLSNMAIRFLPQSYKLINIISATREVVAGVRFNILAVVENEQGNEIVCELTIMEKPWLVTEWGDKQRSLQYTNCSVNNNEDDREDYDHNQNESDFNFNPLFANRYNTITDEMLKALEAQVITPKSPKTTVKPVLQFSDTINDIDDYYLKQIEAAIITPKMITKHDVNTEKRLRNEFITKAVDDPKTVLQTTAKQTTKTILADTSTIHLDTVQKALDDLFLYNIQNKNNESNAPNNVDKYKNDGENINYSSIDTENPDDFYFHTIAENSTGSKVFIHDTPLNKNLEEHDYPKNLDLNPTRNIDDKIIPLLYLTENLKIVSEINHKAEGHSKNLNIPNKEHKIESLQETDHFVNVKVTRNSGLETEKTNQVSKEEKEDVATKEVNIKEFPEETAQIHYFDNSQKTLPPDTFNELLKILPQTLHNLQEPSYNIVYIEIYLALRSVKKIEDEKLLTTSLSRPTIAINKSGIFQLPDLPDDISINKNRKKSMKFLGLSVSSHSEDSSDNSSSKRSEEKTPENESHRPHKNVDKNNSEIPNINHEKIESDPFSANIKNSKFSDQSPSTESRSSTSIEVKPRTKRRTSIKSKLYLSPSENNLNDKLWLEMNEKHFKYRLKRDINATTTNALTKYMLIHPTKSMEPEVLELMDFLRHTNITIDVQKLYFIKLIVNNCLHCNVLENCLNNYTPVAATAICEIQIKSIDKKERVKRQLIGGPLPADNSDEQIQQLVRESITSLSAQENGDTLNLIRVLNATKQIVSGVRYRINAEVKHGDDISTCEFDIWDRPWIKVGGREVTINCSPDKIYKIRQRRSVGHDYLVKQGTTELNAAKLFRKFKQKHHRQYESVMEDKIRFEIFQKNLNLIKELNQHEQGTAKYGITQFADLTAEEYKMRTGLLPRNDYDNEIKNAMAKIPKNIELPTSFDWRQKGAVTEVKDQGNCGSCWAFSVTGNIEGLHAIKFGFLEEYSEQELVDCDKIDSGCNGGLPDNAYKAIEELGGLELETEYPYYAKKSECKYNKTMSRVRVTGAVDLPKNETAIALYLVQNGPISIGINANAMQFYRAGISHPWRPLCSHGKLDHGVLIVGYGVAEYPMFNKTLPYWIIKNSWSPKWGEQGYYRVYRGDNSCGVASMATSAVLK